MPNWCENTLKVSITVPKTLKNRAKKQLKEFKEHCFNEKNKFDFNKIIPMPESLAVENGSKTDNAIAILNYENGNKEEIKYMLTYNWVKKEKIRSMKKLVEKLKEDLSGKDFRNARITIDNKEKYGFGNWYDWSCCNWGTKWNCSHPEILSEDNEHTEICYATAWSPPIPIIDRLIDTYYLLNFMLEYCEPGMGFKGKMGGCLETNIFSDEYTNDVESWEE
jgi:hypothetical protein